MNKFSVALLLATGLFLIDVSPAAAHSGVDGIRVDRYDYQFHSVRRHNMPRWLWRDKGFRHWYQRSPIKRFRRISWNQLFEIYRWERRYFRGRYYASYDNERRWHNHRRRYRDDD